MRGQYICRIKVRPQRIKTQLYVVVDKDYQETCKLVVLNQQIRKEVLPKDSRKYLKKKVAYDQINKKETPISNGVFGIGNFDH